jgi:hypothetical protein
MFVQLVHYLQEGVNGMVMQINAQIQFVSYVALDVILVSNQNGTDLWLLFQKGMDLQRDNLAPEGDSACHSFLME